LDAWVCWHLGEEKKGTSTDSTIEYTTPPWKTLAACDLKSIISQQTYLSNLKYLCEAFDRATGLMMKSNPAIGEIHHLHKSDAIQSIIQKVSVSTTGCKHHVDQIKWETLS
jgi:hypothetical protein